MAECEDQHTTKLCTRSKAGNKKINVSLLLTSTLRSPFAMYKPNQHDILVYHEGFHPEMVSNITIHWLVTINYSITAF